MAEENRRDKGQAFASELLRTQLRILTAEPKLDEAMADFLLLSSDGNVHHAAALYLEQPPINNEQSTRRLETPTKELKKLYISEPTLPADSKQHSLASLSAPIDEIERPGVSKKRVNPLSLLMDSKIAKQLDNRTNLQQQSTTGKTVAKSNVHEGSPPVVPSQYTWCILCGIAGHLFSLGNFCESCVALDFSTKDKGGGGGRVQRISDSILEEVDAPSNAHVYANPLARCFLGHKRFPNSAASPFCEICAERGFPKDTSNEDHAAEALSIVDGPEGQGEEEHQATATASASTRTGFGAGSVVNNSVGRQSRVDEISKLGAITAGRVTSSTASTSAPKENDDSEDMQQAKESNTTSVQETRRLATFQHTAMVVTEILELTAHDIISGPKHGRDFQHYAGNVKLSQLILQNCERYRLSDYKERAYMIPAMVEEVKVWNHPGRFLKLDPQTSAWVEVPDEYANLHVLQLFLRLVPVSDTTDSFTKEAVQDDVAPGPRDLDKEANLRAAAAYLESEVDDSATENGLDGVANTTALLDPEYHVKNANLIAAAGALGFEEKCRSIRQIEVDATAYAMKSTTGSSVNTLSAGEPRLDNRLVELRKRSEAGKEYILSPGKQDVLCGLGYNILKNAFRGNAYYRQLVSLRIQEYAYAGTWKYKLAISRELVSQWRSLNGRFLEEDGFGWWNDIGDAKARRKTSHLLRAYMNVPGQTDCDDEPMNDFDGFQNPRVARNDPTSVTGGVVTNSRTTLEQSPRDATDLSAPAEYPLEDAGHQYDAAQFARWAKGTTGNDDKDEEREACARLSDVRDAFDEAVIDVALYNYEAFHGMEHGTAPFGVVHATSADIIGWAACSIPDEQDVLPPVDSKSEPIPSDKPVEPKARRDLEEDQRLQIALLESVGACPNRFESSMHDYSCEESSCSEGEWSEYDYDESEEEDGEENEGGEQENRKDTAERPAEDKDFSVTESKETAADKSQLAQSEPCGASVSADEAVTRNTPSAAETPSEKSEDGSWSQISSASASDSSGVVLVDKAGGGGTGSDSWQQDMLEKEEWQRSQEVPPMEVAAGNYGSEEEWSEVSDS